MKRPLTLPLAVLITAFATAVSAQEAAITVYADQGLHRVSRYLTGACIEDVNHEIYGGIDSQMIFGESFAEPVPQPLLKGFAVYGGRWTPADDGSLEAMSGDGPKIVSEGPAFAEGKASVDLWFADAGGGNAGLLLKTSQAGNGIDQFNGYEVSLEPSGTLVLGRHRQNWEPIRRVPCEVPLKQWITLAVRTTAQSLEVSVNGRILAQYEDVEHPLEAGTVGLRVWQHGARFRNLSVTTGGECHDYDFAFASQDRWGEGVSGMWRAMRRGSAEGTFSVENQHPYSGAQSQRITFTRGMGEVGIENRGLNRWGMNFLPGKAYEGYVFLRAAAPVEVFVALESPDGGQVYAEKRLKVGSGEWQKKSFTLKPSAADKAGRFVVKLKQPGSVQAGYAYLQPGPWGRFKGLPTRKDVAEGLINQGITVLRQGGCMVNAAEYRWKKMIGPRDRRPPYVGWWYAHSSNGWGIFDFLNFCEAAGFLAVPNVNIGETPQDMADFIEYANGSSESEWGRKRAADGHPKPYRLTHLQIGNEEKVDESYWQKFRPMAQAIWAKDPNLILVIGDFAYGQQITDPFHFTGAAAPISSLAAHQKILQLAMQHHREVWFDVHVGTDGLLPDFGGTFSYIDALHNIADGAKHRVVIFEFNAGNHSQRRALANGAAINLIERDGRLPIATSANCLQPDGQNDNDWNQGLLFLNPSQVWLQPPGYVTRMVSQNFQPLLVKSDVRSPGNALDVTAKRDDQGKTLVLQIVNTSQEPIAASLNLNGFVPRRSAAKVEVLAGPLDARNSAADPQRIKSIKFNWTHNSRQGQSVYTFTPTSFTVLTFN